MSEVLVAQNGGYRYIKSVFQYSAGVAAEPGFEIERARFSRPLRLGDAYAAVEAHLKSLARPMNAFAACELRSPEAFTEQGFYEFNTVYVKTLERWGIYRGGEQPLNPVARTNVCPLYHPPAEPVMHAFSYTVPARAGQPEVPSFIIAGGGERKPGKTSQESVVRLHDTSPEGLREKVQYVLTEMERRVRLLGFSWVDAGSTQIYTVQNVGHLVGELLASCGAAAGGIVWTYARPPVIGLEFEMDVRAPAREIVL
jgi:hypothetical protein